MSAKRQRSLARRIALVAILLLAFAAAVITVSTFAGRAGDPGARPPQTDDAAQRPRASVGRPARFTVAGSVTGLTVGVWKPVAVTITNPNRAPIRVTRLSVAVSGNPNGCRAGENLETRAASAPFVVPARAVAYPVPVSRRPAIRLRNRNVNQDRCKGQSFALVFQGAARQP
jgi:hypothetical protein